MRRALLLLGLVNVMLGVWASFVPHDFWVQLADFGPYGRHLVVDVGTVFLALGVSQLLAVRFRPLQPGVLVFSALWPALHAINHLIDLGKGENAIPDVVELLGLALAAGTAAILIPRRPGRPMRKEWR